MLNLVFAHVSVLLCCLASLHQACNQFDHESLLSFSLNISSSLPLNWSSSADCCQWEGISCDTDGRVTSLWLPSRGLSGVLSPSIWNLTHLSQLNLSHNHFSGNLAAGFFSSLIALETLDLSSNAFHGEIPSTFFELLGNLASFSVRNNGFTGSIPSSICFNSTVSVKLLDFSYNEFSGEIPDSIGQCSQLQIFRAGFNSLSGSIPQDIYKVVLLQEISLPSTGLSGPISLGISNLTNLKILELYGNQLTGFIPPDIGKLSNLEQLLLHTNNLTGHLPASITNCTNLVTLNLGVNYLQGEIATFDFSELLKLRNLDLGGNNFTGTLPQSMYSCQSLTAIRLSFNQFEGQILSDIVALKSLSFLSLSHNRLNNVTGAIKILMRLENLRILLLSTNFWNESMPSDDKLGGSDGFQNLQILGLGGCQFSGQIPDWLAKLHKLQVLDLSLNQLTGSIPAWFVSLPSLFYVDLSSNLLSGEFPREFNLLPALATEGNNQVVTSYLDMPVLVKSYDSNYLVYVKLSYLPPAIYLSNNSLTGNIPVEISQLKFLHVLDLSNNNFSGNIPNELSKLTNLEKLDLSGNHLTGRIPESLKGLHFLSWFSIAENNLQGTIPSGGQFDTFPLSSFVGNPGLCGSIVQRSCSYQPQTTNPVNTSEESSSSPLSFGLIAGLTFGFVIGSASGLLYPIKKLKFLQKHIRFIHQNGHKQTSVSPLYVSS